MRDELHRRSGDTRERLEWADRGERDPVVCLCARAKEALRTLFQDGTRALRHACKSAANRHTHVRLHTRARRQMLL